MTNAEKALLAPLALATFKALGQYEEVHAAAVYTVERFFTKKQTAWLNTNNEGHGSRGSVGGVIRFEGVSFHWSLAVSPINGAGFVRVTRFCRDAAEIAS